MRLAKNRSFLDVEDTIYALACRIVALDRFQSIISWGGRMTWILASKILILWLVGRTIRHWLIEWVLRLVQYNLLQLSNWSRKFAILLGQIVWKQLLALLSGVVQLIDLIQLLLGELISITLLAQRTFISWPLLFLNVHQCFGIGQIWQ